MPTTKQTVREYAHAGGSVALKVFSVAVHPCEEGGYWAEIPEIGYCNTQGETIAEVEANMFEAISLCIEDLPEIGEYTLEFDVCDA